VSALRLPSPTLIKATALGAAAIAAGVLLLQPAAKPPAPPGPHSGDIPLHKAWPRAALSAGQNGVLDQDNTTYTPRLYLNPGLSIGIARTPDGEWLRVLLRNADGSTHELRRLHGAGSPSFNGFTPAGDQVVWAETVAGTGTTQKTSIWRANWRTFAVSPLVADAGSATFRKSGNDIVVAGGQVHWLTGGNIKHLPAALHSVPLTGGTVTSKPVPTLLSLTTWPWLSTAEASVSVAATLYRADTGKRQTVSTTPAETVKCTPAWCLVGVAGATGTTRLDAMRPNGTDRHRIAGPDTAPVLNDVAIADRFQPLGIAATDNSGTVTLQVVDLTKRQTVRVASGVAVVEAQGTMLWWAVGRPGREYTWYALDLATVPA